MVEPNNPGLAPVLASLFSELTHAPQPPHRVLQLILQCMRDIYGLDAAVIYFADYITSELVCLHYTGYNTLRTQDGPPRYKFTEHSFASKIFQSASGCFSEDPWNDACVSPRGLEFFNIHTPLVGTPLIFEDRRLGVLVAWSLTASAAKPEHVDQLLPFGKLAAAYLAMSTTEEKRTRIVQQLWTMLTHTHIELSKEAALTAIMEALRAFPFDRVRLFEFQPYERSFIPLDCLGMDDRSSFLKQRISVESNPYARDTFQNFLTNPKARLYQQQFGRDPDSERLQKANDLPWAVAPLVLNDELIGQIVVDNQHSMNAIIADGLRYLDAMSAFTVCALANKRSIQFLSLNSLPCLYRWIADDPRRASVIKRLLVYLTCGEALGFSRAVFLEWHAGNFVYNDCVGSLSSEGFRRVGEIASRRSLDDILHDAPEIYDYELDAALKDFVIGVGDKEGPFITGEVARFDLVCTGSDLETANADWCRDLALQIGDGQVLMAPLRINDRVLGLFIVDRRWQSQPLREVDELALRTFAHLAARLLELNELQNKNARQQSDREWEDMSYYAAHECRDPVNAIDVLLRRMTRAVDRKDASLGHGTILAIREHVEELKMFIEDFLSLAQASNFVPVPVRLRPILEQVCRPLKRKGIKYEIDCPLELDVLGDRERLLICFRELATNSCYWFDKKEKLIHVEVHTPSVSFIPLGLDASLRYAVVHFEDNGSGVRKEDEARIFDPKFTNRRNDGGNGIGLYMIKRTVEAHKGMITQYGRPGFGNTVAIFLPICP